MLQTKMIIGEFDLTVIMLGRMVYRGSLVMFVELKDRLAKRPGYLGSDTECY
jgi:hypothetical protein